LLLRRCLLADAQAPARAGRRARAGAQDRRQDLARAAQWPGACRGRWHPGAGGIRRRLLARAPARRHRQQEGDRPMNPLSMVLAAHRFAEPVVAQPAHADLNFTTHPMAMMAVLAAMALAPFVVLML